MARKKIDKRTLKGFTIKVLPNPDLGMLETMRDSLALSTANIDESDKEKAALTILGFSIKQLFMGLTAIFVFLFVLIKSSKWLYRTIKLRKMEYQNSELFYFRQFKKAVKNKDTVQIQKTLYRWIDQIKLEESTVRYFVQKYGSEKLKPDMEQLNNKSTSQVNLQLKYWVTARKKYLKNPEQSGVFNNSVWINPK